MRATPLGLTILLTLPVVGLSQPVEAVDFLPKPIVAADTDPLDITPAGDGFVTIFTTGATKYEYGRIFTRAFDAEGEATEPVQRFLGDGAVGAVAASDTHTLAVWVGAQTWTQLLGHDGVPVAPAQKIADHAMTNWLHPIGIYRIEVIPRPEGWLVTWLRLEYSERVHVHLEGLHLDHDGVPSAPPFLIAGNLHERHQFHGPVSLGSSAYALGWATEAGATVALYDGETRVDTIHFTDATSIALSYNGSVLAGLLTSASGVDFVVLDDDLGHDRRRIFVVPSEGRTARAPLIAWDGTAWLTQWSLSPEPDNYLAKVAGSGVLLHGPTRIQDRAAVALASTGSGVRALLSHEVENGREPRVFATAVADISMDGMTNMRIASERVADASLLDLVPLPRGRWLALYVLDRQTWIDVVSPEGSVAGAPVMLSDSSMSSGHIERSGSTHLVALTVEEPQQEATLLRVDASSGRVEILDERSFGARTILGDIATSPFGIVIYYTSSPYARIVHNIERLSDSFETIALRQFDHTFPSIDEISTTRSSVVLGLRYEGYGIEVLDTTLDTILPRTSIIPPWTNPDEVVLSSNGARVLATWINDVDHIRTVVLGPGGEIVGGADGGTVVTHGGIAKFALHATPQRNGWLLSWVQPDPEEASEHGIYRIQVDADGKLITPLPHTAADTLAVHGESFPYRWKNRFPVVWQMLRRNESPWGSAHRSPVYFVGYPERGARPPMR